MILKELERVGVIQRAISGNITQKQVSEIIGLSERQIRRIVKRIRKEGNQGICHQGRGKTGNRKLTKELRKKVIDVYKEKLTGFGPVFAAEKLFELYNIKISHETLRLWLIEEEIDYPNRRKRPHRRFRERKEHYGEMLQIDGSHHDWFEGRGHKCVLMGYIDDATGKVFGRFYDYEGTYPALDSFNRYAQKNGLPMSIYVDRHTTYKSPAKPSIEDELKGEASKSQFERALAELGVKVIHAHSPQAKGRIERLFRTFQDRLVKEMRLASVNDIEQANRFLEEYLISYNTKFCVEPAKPEELHRPVLDEKVLAAALCIKEDRTVRNDGTISHNRKLYQLDGNAAIKKVVVEERLDGKLYISHKGLILKYKPITQRPLKKEEKKVKTGFKKQKPAADHPWRKRQKKKVTKSDVTFSSA